MAVCKYDAAPMHEQIIEMRMHKKIPQRQIAKQLGIGQDRVAAVLRQYREEVRDRLTDIVEERYAEHDELLEHLLTRCMEKLNQNWSLDTVKVILLVLDRSSKLHGLDKVKAPHGQPVAEWMTGATDDQLIEIARANGIPVPQKFTLA